MTEHAAASSPIETCVINLSENATQGTKNLSEVLERQSGLEIVPGVRGSTVRLQGFDSKYVLILIDGQRVSGRIADAIDLSSISTHDIERIEILKGSGSVLYGSDAIGGVINIITRKPKSSSVDAALQGGSDGGRSIDASLQIVRPSAQHGFFVRAEEQSPWYRRGARASSLSGQRGASLALQREDRLSRAFRLGLKASLQRHTLSGRDLSGAGALWDRSNEVEHQQWSIAPSYQLSDGSQLKLASQYQLYRDSYETQIASRSTTPTKEKSQERIAQHTLTFSHIIADSHLLTWGAEQLDEDLDSDRVAGKKVQRWRRSIFLQDEWSIDEASRWVVVPGVRRDEDSQFGGNVTSKLGVKHLIGSTVLRSSYGQGYRAPSFKELYLRFENPSAGYVVAGYDQLKPERSEDFQISIQQPITDDLSVQAEAFRNRIRNMIESVDGGAAGDGLSHYSYRNIAAARTEGLDLSLNSDIGQASLQLQWQMLQTRDETRGLPLEGRAKQHMSYMLSRLPLQARWYAFHSAHWWGPRIYHRFDGSEDISPSTFNADAGVSWELSEDWTLRLTIRNLTNAWDERNLRIRDRSYLFGINWNTHLEEGIQP